MTHAQMMNTTALITASVLALALPAAALAGPTGGTVAAGTATITAPTGTQTLITQTTQNAVIDWTGFNTVAGESVQFAQPNSSAVALNRISGGPTSFAGSLTANGKVWLINPDGMLFSNATINVGSLLLSNASIANATTSGFYTNSTGHYVFDQAGTKTARMVIDHTVVTANGDGSGHNGDIVIMGPSIAIQNHSEVRANSGAVVMRGGETFLADFDGDGLINYEIIGASITSPVSAIVPGADSTIYVGTGSSIQTLPTGVNSTDNKIIFGTSINKDAALTYAINLGGQDVYQYTGFNNPEHITLGNFRAATSTPSAPLPPTPTPAAIAPITQNIVINPLTRPIASLSDETVNDSVVNPSVANVTYARPYLVSLSTSVADGKLTLSSSNTTANSPTNLGNLAPAAGGNSMDATALNDLSPAAGGTVTAANGSSCANSYLDSAWQTDKKQPICLQ